MSLLSLQNQRTSVRGTQFMVKMAWKRLNATDYKNINGGFAGAGGGGATYIVLGKSLAAQEFSDFFPALDDDRTTLASPEGPLTVSSDPERRDGEWLIVDQRGNRHPAWSAAAGFPEQFDPNDPVVVVIFRGDDAYHPGWLRLSEFAQLAPPLADRIRGVDDAPVALLTAFELGAKSALDEFAEVAAAEPEIPFDPANVEDARRRVLAAVVRRQGQRKFRDALFDSYGGKCAVTGCVDASVLEAAHISPYRGPDTNKADNGLLLRADIHTLFDLGLISVNPETLQLKVAKQIETPEYRDLDGEKLSEGATGASKAALREHWDRSTD